MIKIEKDGRRNVVICDFCGSELSYEKDDIYEREVPINQFNSYFQKYITCPKCKCKVIL